MTEATATGAGANVVPGWPRWVSRLVAGIQGLVMGVGFLIMFAGSAAIVDAWSDVPILPSVPGVVLGWIVVVAIHEAGHFIVARRAGMTPYCVAVTGLYAWASSDGWRVRFTRLPASVGGFVASHFNADRPLREQMLPMLAAGSAANLLAGVLLGAVGAWFWPSTAAAYLCALAVLSACGGVANLLPTRNKFLDNDGLLLLQWLRDDFEHEPGLLMHRLNALSLKGVPADQLPAKWVDGLRDMPVLGPALRHWFRLCALKITGAWAEVAGIGREFESDIQDLPPDAAKALSVFIRQMRTEVAFSEAMASGRDSGGICRHIDKLVDWHLPALRPRCQALEAALRGDTEQMHLFLRESERKMRKTHDLGYRNSEERIRRSIRAMADLTTKGTNNGVRLE